MKKYLITGALALVACATLTSCHSDDELSGSLVQQKIKAYEQVFEEEFGKVDPNQDWGFGTAEILARTRTAMARTRTSDPDANMWALTWTVPQELTEGQKLRVTRYFQTHKNPGSTPNYGNRSFFVQQVYDGGTDPITNYSGYQGNNPQTGEPYSTEVYKAANGGDIHSGEHMDHLIAGPTIIANHIYNFNNGTYGTNGEPNHDVLNSEGIEYYSTGNGENYHSDQIMLMLNHDTYPWSYANSDDSYVRNDRWTLVDAATIDAWADAQNPKIGETVDDRWHRSFIGFDFDQLPDAMSFARANEKWDYQAQPQKLLSWDHIYAKYSELPDPKPQYCWDGTNLTTYNNESYLTVNDKMVPYLSSDQNQYCGQVIGINNMDNLNDYPLTANFDNSQGATNDASLYINVPYEGGTVTAINMKFIKKLIDQKYLPVQSKGLQKWVQVGGCNDGYYSDWIVSFMPADGNYTTEPKTDEIPIEPGSQGDDYRKDVYYKKVSFDEEGSGRVFCEDLGVVSASDIDFNDIVFDVLMYKTELITEHLVSTDGENWELDTEQYGGYAREVTSTTYDGDVWLLAGGGTIPATIQAGGNTYNVKNEFEYQLSDKVIVNTIENDEGRYGNPYRNFPTAKKLNAEPLAITSVADVKIFVTYGAEFAELTAFKGVAPHKICVPLGTKWLKEREEISLGYPSFTKYVKYQDADGNSLVNGPGTTTDENGQQIGDGQEYDHDERANSVWANYNITSLFTTPDVTYTPRHQAQGWSEEEVKTGESTVSGGGTNSGYREGDPVLVRRRH